jgi:hypothetical protein
MPSRQISCGSCGNPFVADDSQAIKCPACGKDPFAEGLGPPQPDQVGSEPFAPSTELPASAAPNFVLYSILHWVSFGLIISWVSLVLMSADAIYEHRSIRQDYINLAKLTGYLAYIPGIWAFVLYLQMLHRSWKKVGSLNPMVSGFKCISPRKAVGFLFIPFFNLYWLFIAHVGLAKRSIVYVNERGGAEQHISPRLGIALSVCMILTVPYVGYPAMWVLLFLYARQLNRFLGIP